MTSSSSQPISPDTMRRSPQPLPIRLSYAMPDIQRPVQTLQRSEASIPQKPAPALMARLASFESLLAYRAERAEYERALARAAWGGAELSRRTSGAASQSDLESKGAEDESLRSTQRHVPSGFRHWTAEVAFGAAIATTQLLAEYMISGFALELTKILARDWDDDGAGEGRSGGKFWPASLLSLTLSATLLASARVSDMYGGYGPFMLGVLWLGIWAVVAGFGWQDGVVLDVARAMQGLGIAAATPSVFALVGALYPQGGARKNFVLAVYAGAAPLGFFTGLVAAAALPDDGQGRGWYFWIAAVLAFLAAAAAYFSVPQGRTDRSSLGLKMDWAGTVLITAGLILVSYALAVEPYAAGRNHNSAGSGWATATVLAPLCAGVASLIAAVAVEGWLAACPLLPFEFFVPSGVFAFCMAGLCFYACYGVWLYESARFFQSAGGVHGVAIAAWYAPTAAAGAVLCLLGGVLVHCVPATALLLVSAAAWIAAPLLLALAPHPLDYWASVLPSMLCASAGIDLTFTLSVVFLAAVQPLRYQGLAGAVSSILVNLAMSFSLSVAEIAVEHAQRPDHDGEAGFRAAFLYAAASATLGTAICVLFVRIPRAVVAGQSAPEVRPQQRCTSEVSTLVAMCA